MGNQTCAQANTSGGLTEVSSVPFTAPGIQSESVGADTDGNLNPLKRLINQNKLHSNIVASNNILQDDSPASSPLIKQMSTLEVPAQRHITSPTASCNKLIEFESARAVVDEESEEGRSETFQKSEVKRRTARPSIEIQITHDLNQKEDKENIMETISEYILSEKIMFQPIKISKETFIRFKQKDINQDYDFYQKLGEGSYGNVFKVKTKESLEIRAVKIMKKSKISEERHSRMMNEIEILRKLDHPNVIKIYEAYHHQGNYYIVTEYCSGGSLSKYLKNHKAFSQNSLKIIFRKLLSVLTYLETQRIIHRDIKLENVVVVNNLENVEDYESIDIRLIDFGLATTYKSKQMKDKEKMGTYTHMAPEVIRGWYSPACDVWSCGIMLYYLLVGYNPFRGKTKEDTLENIVNKQVSFKGQSWAPHSNDVKDLLIKLLNKNITARLSAWQALNHSWLRMRGEEVVEKRVFQRVSRKICDYYRGNNLVSMVESLIAFKTLSQQEIKESATMFSILDRNCDGFIERDELQWAFQKSGYSFEKKELEYIMTTMDNNFKGKIDYSQFVAILSDRSSLFVHNRLQQAFTELDTQNQGYLNKSDLMKLCRLSDRNEIEVIVKDLDENQDEKISKQEFIRYFLEFRYL